MTAIATAFAEVLAWVLASLQDILDAVIAQPVLALFVGVAIIGTLFRWFKGTMHF